MTRYMKAYVGIHKGCLARKLDKTADSIPVPCNYFTILPVRGLYRTLAQHAGKSERNIADFVLSFVFLCVYRASKIINHSFDALKLHTKASSCHLREKIILHIKRLCDIKILQENIAIFSKTLAKINYFILILLCQSVSYRKKNR